MSYQGLQFVGAAMNIADNVERTVFMGTIIPKWHALDDRRFDLFRAFEQNDMPKAFVSESTN